MATALAYATRIATLAAPAAGASEVSTTLPLSAPAAYAIFADAMKIPRWLPIVQSARVLTRDRDGRAARVSFMRTLERGSLGYTLEYRYDTAAFEVSWTTLPSSNIVLSGEARFMPLSGRACMMLYRLALELPIVDDALHCDLDRHPASVVVAEFREHLRRLC
jgi:uncharacterized membrane protein